MAVNRYCRECIKKGEFFPLKFVMMSITSGLWTCPKDDCIFPLNSPMLEEYIEDDLTTEKVLLLSKKSSKYSKRSKILNKDSLKALQDNSSSSGSPSGSSSFISDNQSNHSKTKTESKTTKSLQYPIWENEGLLCWLDAALSLLIFNTTFQEETKTETNVNCIFSLVYLEYKKILKSYRHWKDYRTVQEALVDLRKIALNFLQPKLLSTFGDEDSPLFSLPLLIKTHKEVYRQVEFDYQCTFQCEDCGFNKKDGFRKVIMTLPNGENDLQFCDNIYFTRPCYRCNKEKQKSKVTIETFPNVLIVHFPQGVCSKQYWLDYNFTNTTDEYIVTQIVQYLNRKRHFVLWTYSYKEKLWLEADDLKHHTVTYQHRYPKCPPSEVHMIVWERVSILKNITETPESSATRNLELAIDKNETEQTSKQVLQFPTHSPKLNQEKKVSTPAIPIFKPYVSRKKQVSDIKAVENHSSSSNLTDSPLVDKGANSLKEGSSKISKESDLIFHGVKEHVTIDDLNDIDIDYAKLFTESDAVEKSNEVDQKENNKTLKSYQSFEEESYFELEDLLK